MSSSELRYLIAANNLAKELQSVKQTDIANKLHVTKVSAYSESYRKLQKEKDEWLKSLHLDENKILDIGSDYL